MYFFRTMPESMGGVRPVEEAFRRERVSQLCRSEPAQAAPDARLAQVVRSLEGDSGGCVTIVDDHARPVGIFTERDYLDKVALQSAAKDLGDEPIGAYMTPTPRVLREDESLEAALQLMTKGGYRHLPLVDGRGRLRGVLSARDIIAYLAQHFPAEVLNLPPRRDRGMDRPEGE